MNTQDFENLTFNTFNKENILLDDSFDPDNNFFHTHDIPKTIYFTPDTLKTMIKENNDISFSVLHLNIRRLNKNFESLRNLLAELNYYFKIICKTESWCSDDLRTNNRYYLPNYKSIHQVRKSSKTGGGITIFLHKDFIYNIRDDLSVNNDDTEALSLEIINQNQKIFLLTLFTDNHLETKKILKTISVNF